MSRPRCAVRSAVLRAGLLSVVVTLGCDRLHGPFVHNGLEVPIEVFFSYESGQEASARLPPNAFINVGDREFTTQEVRIASSGETLFTISRSELEDFVGRANPDTVGITIEEDGARLLSRQRFEQLVERR